MAKNIHKGSELRNISETWDENERKRASGNAPDNDDISAGTNSNLDQVIKEEASAYDQQNKEEQLLSGDRATVNDDANDASGEEE